MFIFKKPIIEVDERFKEVQEDLRRDKQVLAFKPRYSQNVLSKEWLEETYPFSAVYMGVLDSEGNQERFYLTADMVKELNGYADNRELYKEEHDKLMDSFSDYDYYDRIKYADVLCPYTGKKVRELTISKARLDFKEKKIKPKYYNEHGEEAQYRGSYTLYKVGEIKTPKTTSDKLEHNYSKEVLDLMKEEWSYEESEEVLSSIDYSKRDGDIVITEDFLDTVTVYYPHTREFLDKKAYVRYNEKGDKEGRFFKYKGRNPIPSPEIDNFEDKLKIGEV